MLTLVVVFVFACKKNNTTPSNNNNNNNNNNATACNGMNFCMKLDGTQMTKNATWKVINSTRNRVYWEEGSGNNYKNIELDVYGPTTGSYSVVNANAASGQATFQYYINDNGNSKNIEGVSGTVEVTSVANDKISGTFTITAKDGNGTTYQVTEGNFVNVPK